MSFQVNIDSIRETYRYMGDEELLAFAREDGSKLSADAYLVLKETLHERQIGADIIEAIDREIMLGYALKMKKFEEDFNYNLFSAAIDYALKQKEAGASQYAIYAGLIELGIPEDKANYIINRLDEWAATLHKEEVTNIQAGIALMIVGGLLVYMATKIGEFVLPAVMLVLIGLVRTITALDKKRQLKKVVAVFEKENKQLSST